MSKPFSASASGRGGLLLEDVADREPLDGQHDHAGRAQRDAVGDQGAHGQFGDRGHGGGELGGGDDPGAVGMGQQGPAQPPGQAGQPFPPVHARVGRCQVAELLVEDPVGDRGDQRRVLGERDPQARAEAVEETYAEDVVFADPESVVVGRAALNDKTQALLDQFPGFVFATAGPAKVAQDIVYLAWQLGPEGQPPVATGADISQVENSLITKLWTLLEPPAPS